MLYTAKARAKKEGLDFNLDISDIQIPHRCPYLDVILTRAKGYGWQFGTNPSLDRIDPEKGYIKGNVQVISTKANRMKQNASLDELVQFAKGVLNRHA